MHSNPSVLQKANAASSRSELNKENKLQPEKQVCNTDRSSAESVEEGEVFEESNALIEEDLAPACGDSEAR